MNEIGWVKIPMFGRTSISLPSRTKVFWPIFGARQGVAGASRMSTSRKSASACSRKWRRNFCACCDPGAGQHRAGDQPVAHVRVEVGRAGLQAAKMKRRALDHGDEIGRGARPLGFGEFDDPLRLQRRARRVSTAAKAPARRSGRNSRRALRCAGPRRPRSRLARRARRERRPAPDRPRRGRASRRRRARDRRRSGRTGRDGRGSRRTGTFPRATAARRSA